MTVGSDDDAPLGDFIDDAEAMSAENAVISADCCAPTSAACWPPSTSASSQVVRMRYGLDDGQPRTLDEIGKLFKLSRERIRQIERETMAKLRHGERADRLRYYAS